MKHNVARARSRHPRPRSPTGDLVPHISSAPEMTWRIARRFSAAEFVVDHAIADDVAALAEAAQSSLTASFAAIVDALRSPDPVAGNTLPPPSQVNTEGATRTGAPRRGKNGCRESPRISPHPFSLPHLDVEEGSTDEGQRSVARSDRASPQFGSRRLAADPITRVRATIGSPRHPA